jgi:hypothetical protein
MNPTQKLAVAIVARSHVAKGWMQTDVSNHPLIEKSTAFCIVGAIMRAAIDLRLCRPNMAGATCGALMPDMGEAIGLKRRTSGSAVANWNDALERTQAEIVAAFDRLIANLKPAHEAFEGRDALPSLLRLAGATPRALAGEV